MYWMLIQGEVGNALQPQLALSALLSILWEIQTVEIWGIYLPSQPTFSNSCPTHSSPEPFSDVSKPLPFRDGNCKSQGIGLQRILSSGTLSSSEGGQDLIECEPGKGTVGELCKCLLVMQIIYMRHRAVNRMKRVKQLAAIFETL